MENEILTFFREALTKSPYEKKQLVSYVSSLSRAGNSDPVTGWASTLPSRSSSDSFRVPGWRDDHLEKQKPTTKINREKPKNQHFLQGTKQDAKIKNPSWVDFWSMFDSFPKNAHSTPWKPGLAQGKGLRQLSWDDPPAGLKPEECTWTAIDPSPPSNADAKFTLHIY